MFSFRRKVGNKAENLALKHLKRQGLCLIQQNYLTKIGEIDIIMLDKSGSVLVFVEVRYRRDTFVCGALESISKSKQVSVIRAARMYLEQYPKYQEFECRFDVVTLEFDLKCPTINWIKGAFEV